MASHPARIDQTDEWQALRRHHQELEDSHLRELFAAETVRLLVALAERAGLRERIDAMFAGERINTTEDRAVLHVALRAPAGSSIEAGGEDVVPGVHAVLDRMA